MECVSRREFAGMMTALMTLAGCHSDRRRHKRLQLLPAQQPALDR